MKVTLITGGASGLGKELANLYGKDNNNLLIVDINEENLEKVSEDLIKLYPNIKVFTFKADLSKVEDMKKVYEFTKENDFFVNNLLNCAGFGDCTDFKDMDIDKQLKMTEVNCNAPLYFSRVFLDNMLKNNEGHIINVSSIAGLYPGPYMLTYHCTKSFVYNFSLALSFELRKTNVKVLTLCPGPFNSNFVSKAHNDYTFKLKKPLEAKDVALIAKKQSLKGKNLYIIGAGNRIQYFFSRFAPHNFILKTSAKTLKKDI